LERNQTGDYAADDQPDVIQGKERISERRKVVASSYKEGEQGSHIAKRCKTDHQERDELRSRPAVMIMVRGLVTISVSLFVVLPAVTPTAVIHYQAPVSHLLFVTVLAIGL